MDKCYKHPDRAGIRYYGKNDVEQIGNSVPPVCDECMEKLKKISWYMDNPENSHKHIEADKCEVIDGVVIYCKDFNVRKDFHEMGFDFCPYCGVDIRELEKPLIAKSGNTFVAHFDGVDYLCICPTYCNDPLNRGTMLLGDIQQASRFLPFSEIELTDEIALLRPMVFIPASIHTREQFDMLVYVNNIEQPITAGGYTEIGMRLATAKELSDDK